MPSIPYKRAYRLAFVVVQASYKVVAVNNTIFRLITKPYNFIQRVFQNEFSSLSI